MNPLDRRQEKPDTKLAEHLIYALDFMRKQVGMYPEGHSMISLGLDSALDVLQEIFALKLQITICVEKDALYVGGEILDKKKHGNRQFTRLLNDLYITSITLSKGLTRDELLRFQNILVMKNSDILVLGNIDQVIADSRLSHIKIKSLGLGYFGTTDEKISDRGKLEDKRPKVKSPDAGYFSPAAEKIVDHDISEEKKQAGDELWGEFASSLITQSTDEREQKPRSPEYSTIDSHDFVNRLNEKTISWDLFLNDYRSMIIQYFRSEDEGKKQALENTIFKIDGLAKEFDPQLKQQMFHITENELSSLPPSIIKSNKINCFNYETITEILRRASDKKKGISPALSILFHKLSTIHDQSSNSSGKAVLNASSSINESFWSAKEIEKLIEREQYESYVPVDYEDILRRKSMFGSVGEPMNSERIIAGEYIDTLEDTHLNLQISKLFVALMDEKLNEDEYREVSIYITNNISELILSGHFSFLTIILDTFKRHSREKLSAQIRRHADSGVAVFHDTKTLSNDIKQLFIQGISLDSLVDFVVACGVQNIPWLLDLYLETWSPKGQAMIVKVLRRFREEAVRNILNRLTEMSNPFIKKSLILLQMVGGPDVIPYVKTFADHPDIAIRLEAIRTLLRFEDDDAKALLQRSVFSMDYAESTQAIVLACEYRLTDICEKLILLIRTNIILKKDLVFNEFIITEVIKTRDQQIIRNLEKLAGKRWSLFPGRLSRTKLALLNAIELYTPPHPVKLIKLCLDSKNEQIKTLCMKLMERGENDGPVGLS